MQQQTIQHLRTLKLSGIADGLNRQLEQPNTFDSLSFIERLDMLLQQEADYRTEKKVARLLKAAKFRLDADPNNIDPEGTHIAADKLANIMTGDWITQRHNLIITGATGCGKTYMSCAIGRSACIQGLSVRYYRANKLFSALAIAHGDGSYDRLVSVLSKQDVLIIDDFGLEPFTAPNRRDLLEILEERYKCKSTIIASQLPVDKWHASIGDATLADAILDRIIYNSHRLELKGASMRKKYNNLTLVDQE